MEAKENSDDEEIPLSSILRVPPPCRAFLCKSILCRQGEGVPWQRSATLGYSMHMRPTTVAEEGVALAECRIAPLSWPGACGSDKAVHRARWGSLSCIRFGGYAFR